MLMLEKHDHKSKNCLLQFFSAYQREATFSLNKNQGYFKGKLMPYTMFFIMNHVSLLPEGRLDSKTPQIFTESLSNKVCASNMEY